MDAVIIDFASRSKPFLFSRVLQAGNAAIGKEDYRKATECYTRAIDLNPEDPKTYRLRSLALLKRGDFEKAYTDAKKVIDLGESGIEIKLVMAEITRLVRATTDPEFWAPWVRTNVYHEPGELASSISIVINPSMRK